MKIPRHVAIIMDGNGRWAKKKRMPRTYGHSRGINRIEKIIDYAKAKGVKAITIFAFSTENWKRPEKEVNMLFSYLKTFLIKKRDKLKKKNIYIRFIGRRDRFKKSLLKEIERQEAVVLDNDPFILNMALDYGGRWDIVQAARNFSNDAAKGKINVDTAGEEDFSRYLCLADSGNPDLLIRTSGEMRISNFLLWQLAYAEFYFTPCLWPDFDEEEFDKALAEYGRRNRRFGRIS